MREIVSAMATLGCVFALASCGSEEEEPTIPTDQGDAILAQLEQLDQQVQAGDCAAAEQTALGIQETIQGLPVDVDGELRETLVSASGNLVAQTRDDEQCEEEEEEPPPTGATGEVGVLEEED